MRRCLAGDLGAFAELTHRHRQVVYRVALGIVRCPDEAEDVVQETFLRAYRALDRYDLGREPLGWLRAIAVNCALTQCRRRGRNRALALSEGARGTLRPPERPEQRVAEEQTRVRIEAAIGELPPRQRAAITLFALDQLALAEVAQAMGCSVGSVKKHLHRARTRLGRSLRETLEEV